MNGKTPPGSFDHAYEKVYRYCRECGYQGWDTFDGLSSQLFRNSPLYRVPLVRLAWSELFKASPVNLRRAARVPKGDHAKGLALFASGLLARGEKDEAHDLLERLEAMACPGCRGASWGESFDRQSRNGLTPAGTPDSATTVFVANAMLDYDDAIGVPEFLDTAVQACRFILGDLVLFEDGTTMCIGSLPGNTTRVHNVNMLAATLLARVARLTANRVYLEKSRKAMRYSVKALRPDYSWAYGEGPAQQFIASFHTGLNLVSIKRWMEHAQEMTWDKELRKAYRYYLDNFWLEDGCPRYFHDSLFPIDIHCSAQGIVTCLEFAGEHPDSLPLARRIARWAVENMQDETGYFYYQKRRAFTNRIPYIRWSQAWMFYALSRLTAAM